MGKLKWYLRSILHLHLFLYYNSSISSCKIYFQKMNIGLYNHLWHNIIAPNPSSLVSTEEAGIHKVKTYIFLLFFKTYIRL